MYSSFLSRDGKITGREDFIFENTVNEEIGEILEEFITSFYGRTAKVPRYIYVPKIEEVELLEEFLKIKRGARVTIKIPQKAKRKKCLKW